MKNSIKLSEVIESIKFCFVEVAKEELLKSDERVSDSRLSAMTGVHRKDIARFNTGTETLKPREDLIARVMARWQKDKSFTNKRGQPRVLTCKGTNSEFYSLVNMVNGNNINPYALLFEMERLGIIKKRNDRVKLVWNDFAPVPDIAQGLTMLAEDTSDLISCVSENIYDREEIPNLHLKTYFDKIPVSKLPVVRSWILNQGSLLHKKTRDFLSQYDLDFINSNSTEPVAKVSVGTFGSIQNLGVNNETN